MEQQQLSHQSLNVRPIRARILCHLHHDSFDYHFTPFRGCVWKRTPSASPWDTRPPPPLALLCLLEWIWRMKIGQSSSNIPTPHSPSIITFFNHPHNHLSQRFSLGTRGWSICFLGPCFHPPPPISPSGHSQPLLLPLSATHTLYYGDKDTPMHTPSLLLYVWLKNENLYYIISDLFVQLAHMFFINAVTLLIHLSLLCVCMFLYMQDRCKTNQTWIQINLCDVQTPPERSVSVTWLMISATSVLQHKSQDDDSLFLLLLRGESVSDSNVY